jgi:tetratricopeptide (TPR) repeat protein
LVQKSTPSEVASIAANFWTEFVESNRDRGLDFQLDTNGLPAPAKFAAAYQAVFSADFDSIVGAPADSRTFQRAMMALDRYRLNAAHFLLASILGVQPGRHKPSDLFRQKGALSRLILTTNFDPFLQIALQAVNRLYFMSDTPDLGVSDEIFDDHTDAIHLVYLHGSVHRRAQATSEDQIRAIKERNANTLAPVLKRKGVIVIGYSGWDDAIIEALSRCGDFDHRLYWFGRSADPLTPGAFGPRVAEILAKPSAYYVLTSGAGSVMRGLHNGLCKKIPRLLSNPIGQLSEMLEALDFKDLDVSPHVSQVGLASQTHSDRPTSQSSFEFERLKVIEWLRRVEGSSDSSIADPADLDARDREQFLRSISLSIELGNWQQAIESCAAALRLRLSALQRVRVLDSRGTAFSQLRDSRRAIEAWTAAIQMDQAPMEDIGIALLHRCMELTELNETAAALADVDRIIDSLDATESLKAAAMLQRGMIFGRQGEVTRQLTDFTSVVEMEGLPVERVAEALLLRADAYSRNSQSESAIADYTRIVALPGSPAEYSARAVIARGFLLGDKGHAQS